MDVFLDNVAESISEWTGVSDDHGGLLAAAVVAAEWLNAHFVFDLDAESGFGSYLRACVSVMTG